jgi:manganese/iron transport system permease protein
MLDTILEPLQYAFMQRSLIVAITVGVICAVVGSYLMVQRLALLGDAISHSVLPGLAIAYIVGANIFLGAFIAGIISTLLINLISTRSNIKEDTAMGIVFSAFFALGVTLITVVQKDNKIDLNHFLFGNILAVNGNEVRDTLIIAGIVLTVVSLLYKELLFYTFDKLGAQAVGLPVGLLDLGLMVNRLHLVMLLGTLIGVTSSITGMYLSYYFNLPSGPAIVLVTSGIFVLALLFSPSQGLLTNPSSSLGQSTLIKEMKSLLSDRKLKD